jgi:hypothetical protein
VARGMSNAKVIIVKSSGRHSCERLLGQRLWTLAAGMRNFIWLALCLLLGGFPALGQTPQPAAATGTSSGQQLPSEQVPGSISGKVVDQSGAAVAGARIRLSMQDQSTNQQALSADDGQFFFAMVATGPYQLTVSATGFTDQSASGVLHPGESYTAPPITMGVAPASTELRVDIPRIEIAEEQIKQQEQQRVLAIIPNFYISYEAHPAPLTSKQKFELAWKTTADPVTFLLTGVDAGAEQADNAFSGYGQGAQGYARRYGAGYADTVSSIFIGNAILPSLLKQDPRYFYKGTGSTRSRILYAIANAVICKGDNGHWQPNYSGILGSLAAGGLSNLYYPAANRNGPELTFENTLIGIGTSAAANLLQEFVIRKLTPNAPKSAKP